MKEGKNGPDERTNPNERTNKRTNLAIVVGGQDQVLGAPTATGTQRRGPRLCPEWNGGEMKEERQKGEKRKEKQRKTKRKKRNEERKAIERSER
jgi:hypothetical protein